MIDHSRRTLTIASFATTILEVALPDISTSVADAGTAKLAWIGPRPVLLARCARTGPELSRT